MKALWAAEIGDRWDEAVQLGNLGEAYRDLEAWEQAARYFSKPSR